MSHSCQLYPPRKARACAVAGLFAVQLAAAPVALAGTVTGRLDFPPQDKREPSTTRGYLDAVDNAILPLPAASPAPEMVVVLESAAPDADATQALPRVVYELRGESFSRPVIAVQKGQEIEIKNVGQMPRNLHIKEDANLLPKGTLNVTGTKSFRVTEAGKLYTLVDPAAPHLVGRVLAIATPYRAYPDKDGRFTFENVAEGTYKVRVFFRDRYLAPETSVTVPGGARGKAETRLGIPPNYRVTP